MHTSSEIPILFLNIIPLSCDIPKGSTMNCKSGIADLFLLKVLWNVPDISIPADVH